VPACSQKRSQPASNEGRILAPPGERPCRALADLEEARVKYMAPEEIAWRKAQGYDPVTETALADKKPPAQVPQPLLRTAHRVASASGGLR
jgi:hypothetical protein